MCGQDLTRIRHGRVASASFVLYDVAANREPGYEHDCQK